MSRNGSGTYSLPAGNPVVTGTTISSTTMNSTLSDIASALTGSLAADGQTPLTGNLPAGGFKITNLAAGTTNGDSVRYQQVGAVALLQGCAASGANTDITSLGAHTSGAINGTTIPTSKTLLVSTDIGVSVQGYDADTVTTAPGTSGNVLTSNGSAWTSAAPASQKVLIQQVSTVTSTLATGTTALPLDDTIPQNTEGDERLSVTITPTSATNILIIRVLALVGNSANVTVSAALFQDSTAGALIAGCGQVGAASVAGQVSLFYTMVAGTTSATTFKVRIGATSGTTVFNGIGSGTQLFGGVASSYIQVEEVTP